MGLTGEIFTTPLTLYTLEFDHYILRQIHRFLPIGCMLSLSGHIHLFAISLFLTPNLEPSLSFEYYFFLYIFFFLLHFAKFITQCNKCYNLMYLSYFLSRFPFICVVYPHLPYWKIHYDQPLCLYCMTWKWLTHEREKKPRIPSYCVLRYDIILILSPILPSHNYVAFVMMWTYGTQSTAAILECLDVW